VCSVHLFPFTQNNNSPRIAVEFIHRVGRKHSLRPFIYTRFRLGVSRGEARGRQCTSLKMARGSLPQNIPIASKFTASLASLIGGGRPLECSRRSASEHLRLSADITERAHIGTHPSSLRSAVLYSTCESHISIKHVGVTSTRPGYLALRADHSSAH
jgi:hypothetical protein